VSAEALSHYVAGRLLELSGSSQDAIAEFTRALSLDPAAFSVLLHLSEVSARAGETSQSLEFAERAVKMRPGDGKALWMKGAALFNMQRAPEALPVLQAACAADSDQAEYLRTLARVAETLDRTDIVERAYARSVEIEEEDGESWFQLAAAQARLGKFAIADSSLSRSLELNPIRPGAFFLRGWIRENEGKLDDAIGFYQHHLLVHTTDDGTRGRLVTLLARRERFAEAYDEAVKLAAERKDDPEAIQVEADLAYQMKKPEVGAKALSRMRAIDPADPELVGRSLMVLARHDRAKEGVVLADAWAATRPNEMRGLLLSARARALAGQYDSAAVRARRAIAAAPDSLEPSRLLVRVLMDGGHYAEAAKELEALHRREPEDVAIVLDMGQCRELAGDVAGAETAARQAYQMAPDAPPVQNFLGYLLADHQRDLTEAKGLLDKAIAREPDNGAYVDSYGWLLYRLHRLPEARQYLERALAITGGDATIHEHLGDVLRDLKDTDKAKQQYKLSLAKDATNKRVKDKLDQMR
jgi:tetratricopeptide (TPR) repeat protein